MATTTSLSQYLGVIAQDPYNLNQISKQYNVMPNPDKILQKSGQKYSILKDLLSDAHISSCIQSRKAALLSMEWAINRGTDKKDIDFFIEKIFKDLDLRQIIADIIDAPYYGFNPLEIYWQIEGDYVVPKQIIAKPQDWFYFDTNNILRFRDNLSSEGVIVPPRKFFVVQHQPSYDNPYGTAILSKCFWPVFYKKEEIKFWALYSEKYGTPFTVVKMDNATETEKDAMAEALNELRQDGIAILDNESEVTSLDMSGAKSQDIYKELILFMNAEISKAILSQTLTTEQSSTGSYAMSQTHLQVRKDVVDADKTLVESWMNKLIRWIVELNYDSFGELPKFELYEEEDIDMTLAQRDQTLSSTGYFKFTKEYFQRAYGFKDTEFDIVEQTTPPPTFTEDEQTPEQIGIDNTSSMGVQSAADSMNQLIQDEIIGRIDRGDNFIEIYNELIKAYSEIDVKDIESQIAQALLISNVAGQINGSK